MLSSHFSLLFHPYSFSGANSKETLNTVHQQYYDRSHQLAEDHRFAHEYGETSEPENASVDLDFKLSQASELAGTKGATKSQAVDMKAKFEAALKADNGLQKAQSVDAKNALESAIAGSSTKKVFQPSPDSERETIGDSGLPWKPGSNNSVSSRQPFGDNAISPSQASVELKPQTASAKTSVPASVIQKVMREEAKMTRSSATENDMAAVKIQASFWQL